MGFAIDGQNDWSDQLNSTGDVSNTSTTPVDSPPDASGGSGSFVPQLLSTLTKGVDLALSSALDRNFGTGSNLNQASVNAQGQIKPKVAPGQQITFADQAKAVLTNPYFLIGSALVVLILIAVKRK